MNPPDMFNALTLILRELCAFIYKQLGFYVQLVSSVFFTFCLSGVMQN